VPTGRTSLSTAAGRAWTCAHWLCVVVLALDGLASRTAGANPPGREPARMSMAGLGVVPHGIDVANALAVADMQAGGQKQLISGTQATIL
jgi:hypothetical protein